MNPMRIGLIISPKILKSSEIIRNHHRRGANKRSCRKTARGLDDAQGPNDAHQLHHPQTVGLLILNSPTPQRWLWIKPPGRGLISFNVIQSSSSGLVCFNHVPLRKNHPVFRKATTSHQLLLLNGKKSSKSLGWFQPPEWGRETAQRCWDTPSKHQRGSNTWSLDVGRRSTP